MKCKFKCPQTFEDLDELRKHTRKAHPSYFLKVRNAGYDDEPLKSAERLAAEGMKGYSERKDP
jgi:hypothetical protein